MYTIKGSVYREARRQIPAAWNENFVDHRLSSLIPHPPKLRHFNIRDSFESRNIMYTLRNLLLHLVHSRLHPESIPVEKKYFYNPWQRHSFFKYFQEKYVPGTLFFFWSVATSDRGQTNFHKSASQIVTSTRNPGCRYKHFSANYPWLPLLSSICTVNNRTRSHSSSRKRKYFYWVWGRWKNPYQMPCGCSIDSSIQYLEIDNSSKERGRCDQLKCCILRVITGAVLWMTCSFVLIRLGKPQGTLARRFKMQGLQSDKIKKTWMIRLTFFYIEKVDCSFICKTLGHFWKKFSVFWETRLRIRTRRGGENQRMCDGQLDQGKGDSAVSCDVFEVWYKTGLHKSMKCFHLWPFERTCLQGVFKHPYPCQLYILASIGCPVSIFLLSPHDGIIYPLALIALMPKD